MTYKEQCGADEGPFPYYAAWLRSEGERLRKELEEQCAIADEAIMDNAVLFEENQALKAGISSMDEAMLRMEAKKFLLEKELASVKAEFSRLRST